MKALILIDIQYDYFTGGANQLVDSDKASIQAKNVLQYFRKLRKPVIHIQHISKSKTASFFIEGTRGCEIHESIAPVEGEKLILKHFPNAFRETNLHEYLSSIEVTELIICGMMTHICVDSSVRAAKDLGYTVQLVGNACATKDLKWNNQIITAESVHSSFLSALNGTFATVIQAEEITQS
jgi:nicotinamidase-related amidase